MSTIDPPQREDSTMERLKTSVRAQTFLDVLQRAFQSTWGQPTALTQAMSELSATEEARAGLHALLSFLEALSPSVSRLCGVGGQQDEAGVARQAKSRRKRRRRGGAGGGSSGSAGGGDGSEESADEGKMAREPDLSPTALGQDDKMDSGAGEVGMPRADEAGLGRMEGGGMGILRGVRRLEPGVSLNRDSMGIRRREVSHVEVVLADKDLLGSVLSFVGGETGRQSVRALGQVALVCRKWREVSAWDSLWKGIEEEVVPALWREEQGGRQVVGRDRLVQYGRGLVMERRVWNEHDWTAGLELHVEVFDRMDGLQMLSARGALRYEVSQGEEGVTLLALPALPAVEVRGSSFSAASRDPEQRRFPNIGAYLTQGRRPEYLCSLCVRVTVRDQRTGKGKLLWEEGKETVREHRDLPLLWQQRLPEGSILVGSDKIRVVGWCCTDFYCSSYMLFCPEPNQAGVADEDRLYRAVTGEDISEEDVRPFGLIVDSADHSAVGSAIRAILCEG